MSTSYNYQDGLSRVKETLGEEIRIQKRKKVPSENEFTYDSAYKTCVTAIFIDIRDSTKLFEGDSGKALKIVKPFISETLAILSNVKEPAELGIRGDCTYAIYSRSPKRGTMADAFEAAVKINTIVKLMNREFRKSELPRIKVGIGIDHGDVLITKVGKTGTGASDRVWAGSPLPVASKLSSLGGRDNWGTIVVSSTVKDAVLDRVRTQGGLNKKGLFTEKEYQGHTYFHSNKMDKVRQNAKGKSSKRASSKAK